MRKVWAERAGARVRILPAQGSPSLPLSCGFTRGRNESPGPPSRHLHTRHPDLRTLTCIQNGTAEPGPVHTLDTLRKELFLTKRKSVICVIPSAQCRTVPPVRSDANRNSPRVPSPPTTPVPKGIRTAGVTKVAPNKLNELLKRFPKACQRHPGVGDAGAETKKGVRLHASPNSATRP